MDKTTKRQTTTKILAETSNYGNNQNHGYARGFCASNPENKKKNKQ